MSIHERIELHQKYKYETFEKLQTNLCIYGGTVVSAVTSQQIGRGLILGPFCVDELVILPECHPDFVL